MGLDVRGDLIPEENVLPIRCSDSISFPILVIFGWVFFL